MLPQQNRLKNRKDIDKVFAKGHFASQGFLSAKIMPNQLGISRFAFSIGLNFSKKAVERNRFRRILKALLLENTDKLKTGLDIVFFIKKGEKFQLKTKTVRPVFEEFIQKNNLLKK